MTAANATSMANQQESSFVNSNSNNNISISSTGNSTINITGRADARPSNGNDSPQSHIQKVSNLTSIERSDSNSPLEDNPNKNLDETLVNNGNMISEKATNECTKIITVAGHPLDTNIQQASVLANDIKDSDVSLRDIQVDIRYVLDSLLDRLKSEPVPPDTSIPLSQTSSLISEDAYGTLTSQVSTVEDIEEEEVKDKDMVTLRNLELTPPPQLTDEPAETIEVTRTTKKRTHSESTAPNDGPASEARSKRLRKQTQLFQVVETSKPARTSISSTAATPKPKTATSARKQHKSSTAKRNQKAPTLTPPPPAHTQVSQIPPDVIFYEKNDYLAIRNEENSYYLCQLTENVRVEKPVIKIKWLDTRNGGKTYFLTSHFDKVPQKSIIMPVILNKLKSEKKGEQLFSLDEQAKDSIMERLRRSINIQSEN